MSVCVYLQASAVLACVGPCENQKRAWEAQDLQL